MKTRSFGLLCLTLLLFMSCGQAAEGVAGIRDLGNEYIEGWKQFHLQGLVDDSTACCDGRFRLLFGCKIICGQDWIG